jgi:arginase
MSARKIALVECLSELGAGTRGSSLGPSALRMAYVNKHNLRLQRYKTYKADNFNEQVGTPTTHFYARHIDLISKVVPSVYQQVYTAIQDGFFPFVISGDHSNSAGVIAGIKEAHPDKRLGIVWIDAHADIHSPYTTPSGNMHGMPVAISLGIDNLDEKINEPDELTRQLWEDLKRVGGRAITPKIQASDIVYIDIRDLERQEWDLIEKLNINFYTPKERKEMGIDIIAKETLKYLNACDILYISFDVDSLDPSISKGTGTSYENGLHLHEAKTLLYHLLKSPKTVAFEVTEINPLMDSNNKMARAVMEIVEEVL